MNQNGGIHKGGFAVLCHRNGGSESPGILNQSIRMKIQLQRLIFGQIGSILFGKAVYPVKTGVRRMGSRSPH